VWHAAASVVLLLLALTGGVHAAASAAPTSAAPTSSSATTPWAHLTAAELGALPPATLHAVAAAQLSTIPPAACEGLTPAQLAAIDKNSYALTPACVADMTTVAFSGATVDNVSALSLNQTLVMTAE
jgi:hypothetical protein